MADQAGRMRERVTLQSRTSGRDAAGQPSTGWTDVATVWADVRYLSGVQAIKADADMAMKRASVRIRMRDDVTEKTRAVHRGQALDVKAVLPTADRAFLDLACEAVSNG